MSEEILQEEVQEETQTFKYIVYIQFDGSKKSYTFGSNTVYHVNNYVVVETVRGKELGKVCVPCQPYDETKIKGEIKPVLRLATKYDVIQKKENEEKAQEALVICQQCVDNLQLDMHLISSEYTLDRSKVIITYVSDDRVDFRQLLKDLAAQLHCRIELRQVGPRNKAKMIGGLGNCGMETCCSRFLSDFDTVSINMAKNQMLALNIAKLSGQCGKLMCCLRFENDEYTELKKDLPKINSQITYNGNKYRITSMNLFQKTAKLENKEETLFLSFQELWGEQEVKKEEAPKETKKDKPRKEHKEPREDRRESSKEQRPHKSNKPKNKGKKHE